jgi:hypothetical protein
MCTRVLHETGYGTYLSKVDLSETAKPSKLPVSGHVDLADDVISQFTRTEPYRFLA